MSGKGYSSGSPQNQLQQNLNKLNLDVGQPSDDQLQISYGVVSEVDQDTSQVKVKFLLEDGKLGEELSPGFMPVITPLSVIHHLWGLLREGLVVRIYWKGKLEPHKAMIEVIGDEEHSLLNKEPMINEITIGVWKLFSGGASL
jgi:hypothetical protein